MSQPLNVAVVGATGSVGEALVGLLDERDFPLHRLHLLASAESAGQRMGFAESSLRVGDVDSFDFSSVGLAFFAAAAEVSRAHAERARAAGCSVIDRSGTPRRWRLRDKPGSGEGHSGGGSWDFQWAIIGRAV